MRRVWDVTSPKAAVYPRSPPTPRKKSRNPWDCRRVTRARRGAGVAGGVLVLGPQRPVIIGPPPLDLGRGTGEVHEESAPGDGELALPIAPLDLAAVGQPLLVGPSAVAPGRHLTS